VAGLTAQKLARSAFAEQKTGREMATRQKSGRRCVVLQDVCIAFGSPVTYAKRCADVPPQGFRSLYGGKVTMPASLMDDRDFSKLFPRLKYDMGDGRIQEREQMWKMLEPRIVSLKNLPDERVVEFVNTLCHFPTPGTDPTYSKKKAGQDKLIWPDRPFAALSAY
jgi:hypothetical protein